jgi:hypothetical protein
MAARAPSRTGRESASAWKRGVGQLHTGGGFKHEPDSGDEDSINGEFEFQLLLVWLTKL